MNTFGHRFRFTTFGESHGKALGCIVDGVPAGIKIDEEFIQNEMNRRKPGQNKFATARKEGYKSIQEIQIFNDVGMRYLQSEVDPYQTEIVSDFRSAKELMDLMQKTVEQIILQCDGADEFRSQFRNLVSSFKQVLDNVESQFVELMNKDREQIEKAEKLNTTK